MRKNLSANSSAKLPFNEKGRELYQGMLFRSGMKLVGVNLGAKLRRRDNQYYGDHLGIWDMWFQEARRNGQVFAKLIDFDCSCFGLTDSSLVSIAGTPGWLAPEFVRRNPHFTRGEERKADIYSYGKLCPWILCMHILDIKDFTRNQGRVSGLDYEYFDFVGVLDQLEVPQSSPNSTQGVRSLGTKVLSLLERVFASTFIGDPARRFDEVFQAVAMLERMIYQFETANVVELTRVSLIEPFGAYEIPDHADTDPEAIATVLKLISEPQAF